MDLDLSLTITNKKNAIACEYFQHFPESFTYIKIFPRVCGYNSALAGA